MRLVITLVLLLAAGGMAHAQSRFMGNSGAFTPLVGYSRTREASGLALGASVEASNLEFSAAWARTTIENSDYDDSATSLAASVRYAITDIAGSAPGSALLIGPLIQHVSDNGNPVTLLGASMGAYGRLYQSESVLIAPAVEISAVFGMGDAGGAPITVSSLSLGLGLGTPRKMLLIVDPSVAVSGSGGGLNLGVSAGFALSL